MKDKYVQINNSLLFAEDWIDFLNDMSKKGYKLKKVGFLYYHFQPCNQPLKYQIDYAPLSDEYLQVTKTMGYEYIDSYQDIHIFCSYDLNAVDLQTDEETLKEILLKKYNQKRIILCFTMGVIFGLIALFTLLQYLNGNLGYLYIYFNSFMLSVGTLILSLYFIILGIAIIKARQKIKYQNEMIINSPFLRHLLQIFIYILGFGLVIGCFFFIIKFSMKTFFQYFIIGSIPLILYFIVTHHVIPRQKSDTTRRLLTMLAVIIFICASTLIRTMPESENEKPFDDYPYSSYIIDTDKNIFLTKTVSFPDCFQTYYQCHYEPIAKEVFKTNIQCLPEKQDDREITDNDISIEGIVSYNDAMQYYQQYSTSLADECYYRQHYFVARKGNNVIKCYIREQKDIDRLLNIYFK